MVPRRRLLVILLPLLLVAWSGCPCIYARCFDHAQDVEQANVNLCPCCTPDLQQDEQPDEPVPPCERRSARNGDVPPQAPKLVDDGMPLVALLIVQAPVRPVVVAAAPVQEVMPLPPDDLRRGTVLLR